MDKPATEATEGSGGASLATDLGREFRRSDWQDHEGRTPYHIAAMTENTEFLRRMRQLQGHHLHDAWMPFRLLDTKDKTGKVTVPSAAFPFPPIYPPPSMSCFPTNLDARAQLADTRRLRDTRLRHMVPAAREQDIVGHLLHVLHVHSDEAAGSYNVECGLGADRGLGRDWPRPIWLGAQGNVVR